MEEPRKYETAKYVVSAAGLFLNTGLLIYLLSSGWTFRLRDLAEQTAGGWSHLMVIAVYFAVLGVLFTVAQIPLDFFSGYYLEHRFGLSRQSIGSWIVDQLKGLAIGGVFGLFAMEIVYGLLQNSPERWWIYAALIFIGVFVVLTNLTPVLILPLFFKFTPVENEDLQRRVERLARRVGTGVRGIFEWSLGEKTRKANAAVVGWGNTRRIIVSDTLLQNFSGEEIEVIMAHELCHHVKGHIWLGMALQSLLTLVSFYTINEVLLRFGGEFRGISDLANFPLLALTAGAVSLCVLPGVNAFSRYLERAADHFAIDITGDCLAFVSSMEKLADLNLANKTPNPIIEFIFYSHPSIENRIKLAADRVGQNV
jgi:STE24 endopeptidase